MSRLPCTIRLVWLVGLFFGLASLGRGQERGTELKVIKARQEALQNLSVEYHLSEEFSPPEAIRENPVIELGDGVKVVAKTKPISGRARFRFLYGKSLYEWELDEAFLAGARRSARKRYMYIDSGSRVDRLMIDLTGSQTGMIQDASPLPGNMIVDVAIGLRPHGAADWLEPSSFDGMEFAIQDDGVLRLESPDPEISSRRHVWTFDPAQGYALSRYQVVSSGRLQIDVINSDFEVVDNLTLPKSIVWKRYHFDEENNSTENARKEVKVHRYVLGDPDNTPESYVMVWPVGTSVLDGRTNTPVAVMSGDRTLDDEFLKGAARRYSRGIVGGESDVPQPPKAAWPRRWLLTANLVCIAALVVFLCYRRVRSGTKS